MSHLHSTIALLTCCILTSAAAAQAGVLNSDLDHDVISWELETYAAAAWSAEDAAGSPDSGSIEITNFHPNSSNGQGVTQCLPLVPIPGTAYEFGGMAKIPSGQTRTGTAEVGLRFYDGGHCTGTSVGIQPRRSTSTLDAWVELSRSGEIIPGGARSVLFLAFPSKVEAGGTLVASFDDLYFHTALPFADGLETGDSSAWSRSIPAVITALPYADPTAIEGISRVFCQSGHCPWVPSDQLHDGLDFSPIGDLAAFQASCEGEVAAVDLFLNTGNGKYQVNVMIECSRDETHGVVYAFEPFSGDLGVGNQQLANITVQAGETVSAGDLIGYLVQSDPAAAHVHYGVFVLGPIGQICPAPLFSSTVYTTLLDLVRTDNPSWNFCH